MAFLWRKTMSVGNDAIDHGHRYLIGYVNTIELILHSPIDKELLIEALDQLYEETVKHFRKEEVIQRKIEFPQTLHHRREHKKLLEQLNDARTKIIDCNSLEGLLEYAPELIMFLRNWLVDHVFHEDMLLKPFFSKYPKGYS
ncbi:MAG: hemerythrin family protein [Melioribacteraceae bacterium]